MKNKHIVITKFDHIQLDVADIEESVKFYSDVFGFEVKEVGLRALTRWVIVGNENQLFLCMHEFPEGRGVENEGLEITHFGLIVEEFDEVLNRLKSFNVKLFYEEPVQYHSSRSIYFLDPNGYKLEISEYIGGGL
ncbi:VOC family protein [Paenibacillus faecalis]|uniref:VOC family protein n=1 Tax=Paenibacillus faecalis TaxID=2079532 RepID=UPI000D0F2E99|nr:VOC family protein [Paenibacillus faecalis]